MSKQINSRDVLKLLDETCKQIKTAPDNLKWFYNGEYYSRKELLKKLEGLKK